jgi:hypothetical protein
MLNPNSVISSLIRFEPSLDRPATEVLRAEGDLSIELEGERRVRLDPANPRSAGFAQVLEGLSKLRLPVCVEIDPETSAITHLLIPHVARVVGIRPIDEDLLGVELEPSHGRHVLSHSAQDFDELEEQLREALRAGAQVVLTETDDHEIIDVRGFIPGPEVSPPPFSKPEPPPRISWSQRVVRSLRRVWCWGWWPCRWWCRCISAVEVQQVFEAMQATSCNPLTVPPPCVPFLYPDDGCWARAHEMCRLMINMGRSPKKVWIQGNLHVSTKNNPTCNVRWGWHVAPTLCVRGPRFFQTQAMVIDPSLFAMPVSKETWKGVQGDPNATLTDTDASIYYLWGNITDPNYEQTNQILAFYRLQLQNRAIQQGSPPYANCP